MTGTPYFQDAPACPPAPVISLIDHRLRRIETTMALPDRPHVRLVWSALAHEMRRQRQAACSPSLQRLAALSGLHPQAVSDGLRTLAQAGVLHLRTTADTGVTAYQLADRPAGGGAR